MEPITIEPGDYILMNSGSGLASTVTSYEEGNLGATVQTVQFAGDTLFRVLKAPADCTTVEQKVAWFHDNLAALLENIGGV
jgi:hypothetical protein